MNKKFSLLLTALLTAACLLLFYSDFFLKIDSRGPGYCCDGAKNYYTLAYYIKFDSGVKFTGMNYPFGDNIVFTDNQPALAILLHATYKFIPSVSQHIHALLAWLCFFSVVVAGILIHLSLRELGVGELACLLFSFLTACLSPQFQRVAGHYSLSYVFFVPAVNYYLIHLFTHKVSKIITAIIILIITSFSFIHLYHLGFVILYFTSVLFFLITFSFYEKNFDFKRILHLMLCIIIPFVTLKLYFAFTDTVTDRPSAPWGYFDSLTSFRDLVIHPYSFTGFFYKTLTKYTYNPSSEGACYLGFIPSVVLLLGLIQLLYKTAAKQNLSVSPFRFIMPASLLLLLFAMGIPFIYGYQDLYELLPGALKQFRAAGRFSWLFYNSSVLFSVVFIHNKLKLFTKQNVRTVILFALCALWFYEVAVISKNKMKEFYSYCSEYNEQKDESSFNLILKTKGISKDEFQAILPIPMFLIGSEKIGSHSETFADAMRISLFTGLPLCSGEMSRTSISQTFAIANLLSEPYVEKNILKKYKNNKPLLVISPVGYHALPNEKRILKSAEHLFTFNGMDFYNVPLQVFDNCSDSTSKQYKYFTENYFHSNEYFTSDSTRQPVYLSFDSLKNVNFGFGSGAFVSGKDNLLLYHSITPFEKNDTIELSVWSYCDKSKVFFSPLHFAEISINGEKIQEKKIDQVSSYNNYQMWVKNDFTFVLSDRRNTISVSAEKSGYIFDELMMRVKSANVISQTKNKSIFMFNNFPISRSTK